MQTDVNGMAKDIHLLAAPFRLIRDLIMVSLVILFAPALLVLLIIGSHLQPENCVLAKVLIGVFGPFIFCIWFAGVVYWSDRSDPDYPAAGTPERAWSLAAYFCGLGWVGILLSLMNNLTGIKSLWAMVIGLFSPAIIYVLGRIFGMWLTNGLAVLEIGLAVFIFGKGFGFF